MKIQTTMVTLAVSLAAAAFCFAATPTTETQAATAEATGKAKMAAPAKHAAKPAAKMAAKMAAPMSPQMGTWQMDEKKSKLAAGTGKNTTVVYSAVKDMVKVTVDGVDKDGKPTHSVWMGKFDGKPYAVKGNMPYDAVAYKMVNANTNELTATKGGKPSWSGKIVVSKDGKSRVVTISGTGADGKNFKSRAVYSKG